MLSKSCIEKLQCTDQYIGKLKDEKKVMIHRNMELKQ